MEDLHGYNVLLVFGWSEHNYSRERQKRQEFSEAADRKVSTIKERSKQELESALSEDNYFKAEELRRLLKEEL